MKKPLIEVSERTLRTALKKCGMPPSAIRVVVERRPFADDAALCSAVDHAMLSLEHAELVAALETEPEPEVEQGDADVLAAARLALRLYRDRFGYPYVSSIAAPTADELLMRVRIRLGNEPVPEGRAAREHLRRLVRARLQPQLR